MAAIGGSSIDCCCVVGREVAAGVGIDAAAVGVGGTDVGEGPTVVTGMATAVSVGDGLGVVIGAVVRVGGVEDGRGDKTVAAAGMRPASLYTSPPFETTTSPAAAHAVAVIHCWKTARWVRRTRTSPRSS